MLPTMPAPLAAPDRFLFLCFLALVLFQLQGHADARQSPPRPTAKAMPASHCKPGEQVLFSCALRNSAKIASLCASPELDVEKGYLQYRFGRLDALEFDFPSGRAGSASHFRIAHYTRFQTSRTAIRFRNGGHVYSLYDYYEGEEKPAGDGAGVMVDDKDLACARPYVSHLMRLQDILVCDDKSTIAACP